MYRSTRIFIPPVSKSPTNRLPHSTWNATASTGIGTTKSHRAPLPIDPVVLCQALSDQIRHGYDPVLDWTVTRVFGRGVQRFCETACKLLILRRLKIFCGSVTGSARAITGWPEPEEPITRAIPPAIGDGHV